MLALTKWYVFTLSVYHIWSGAISYLTPRFAMRFYRRFYDCNPIEQRHLLVILRPWGALAIFAGIVGLTALADPYGNPLLLAALCLLLILRVGYRIGLRRDLQLISGITPRRNAIAVACLVVGALILLHGIWAAFEGKP